MKSVMKVTRTCETQYASLCFINASEISVLNILDSLTILQQIKLEFMTIDQ